MHRMRQIHKYGFINIFVVVCIYAFYIYAFATMQVFTEQFRNDLCICKKKLQELKTFTH